MYPKLKFLIFFLSILVYTGCQNKLGWVETLPKPWTLSKSEVSKLLPEFNSRFPNFHNRLKAFALWQVGKPYAIFKLGEEKEPDTDPIIRLDVSDCTVHILTSLAFVQSKSWHEARGNMIKLHYKDFLPDYTTRWHFTSDRILSHPGTVDITQTLLPIEKLRNALVILNQKENGEELLELDWKREVETFFIPNEQISERLLKKIPEICGVAFVKRSFFKLGIIIGHEGMLIDNNLIHASSTEGKTVNVNFLEYYFSNPEGIFDGVMFYEFRPMKSKMNLN